ncbi:MAG: hypothetical protein ABSG33_03985 [Candidatus Bathyarchaeia archaeon]|jgi:hypothetical protein
MGKIGKTFALFLTLIIAMPCLTLLTVKPANAQTTPTVSVPEFTVKFIDNSYNIPANTTIDPFTGKTVTIPAQHINNQTIELSIKNQTSPNGTNLYYEIRMKGHYSQEWTNISSVQANPRSEYTILTYAIDGNNASGQFDSRLNQISSGGTADFQVQAQIWPYPTNRFSQFRTPPFGLISESDWSPTQTITLTDGATTSSISTSPTPNQTSTPSNTPAIPEFPSLTILPLFLSTLLVYATLRQRRINVD